MQVLQETFESEKEKQRIEDERECIFFFSYGNTFTL